MTSIIPSAKLLLPTFFNRFNFIEDQLKSRIPLGNKPRITLLHLGCGEGDYDAMLSVFCTELVSCDINKQDVLRAQLRNRAIAKIRYQVEDATSLSFESEQFDVVVSVDVLEHAGNPELFLKEVHRVLKPGGLALITFPNRRFPIAYDPINWLLESLSLPPLKIGAYAFGHEWLPSKRQVVAQALQIGLCKIDSSALSKSLVGAAEMYWVGLAQKFLKPNSTNSLTTSSKAASPTDASTQPPVTRSFFPYRLPLKFTRYMCKIDRLIGMGARDGINTGLALIKL